MNEVEEELLSVTAASKIKNCTRSTIYSWINKGYINTMTIADRTYIKNDVDFKSASLQKRCTKEESIKFTGLILKLEDQKFVGYVPEYPGVISQGKNQEEALKNLKNALKMVADANRKRFYSMYDIDMEKCYNVLL